jgi:hypothetical protein
MTKNSKFLWPLYMNLFVNNQVYPAIAEYEVDVLKLDHRVKGNDD